MTAWTVDRDGSPSSLTQIKAELFGLGLFYTPAHTCTHHNKAKLYKNHISKKRIDARRLDSYNLWAFFEPNYPIKEVMVINE
jgi:hypothetical protein